ncbi:MAG: hypothetical protein ABL951_11955 [Alphaproteobacteria bacterium]
MESDIEKLNMELIQAQILLRASHDLFEDILVQINRRRISGINDCNDRLGEEIGQRVARFGQRDEEIRRMLLRLEKLGKPSARVA